MGFLRSIGGFLANIFAREKIEIKSNSIHESQKAYGSSQSQDYIVHYNQAKEEVTITKKEDENVKKVSNTFEIESRDQKRTSGLEHTLQEAEQKFSEMKKPSGIREFLRSIPIIGRFIPEKIEITSNPIYTSQGVGDEKLQQGQARVHSDKVKGKVTNIKEGEDVKKVSSKVEKGSIRQVDDSKKDREPGRHG